MTRFSFRLLGTVVTICMTLVFAATAVGRVLPDDNEIVYSANLDSSDSEIYRMSLGRQLTVALTRNNDEDNQPAWSADGQQIAFVSNHQGQFTIYVMDAEGRGFHRLTDSPFNNFSPTWSPDDRSIAYVTARQEFAQHISEVLLTDLGSGLTRRVTISYPKAMSPTWSPDSRHLAFTSDRNGNRRIIYSVDTQTGDINPLVANHDAQQNPTWSPDGKYLLYLAYDNNPGIYLWDAARSQSVLLFTPPLMNIGNPSWSPDNRYVIYAPLTSYSTNNIMRLDVTTCLQQREDCIPQTLTHTAGIYDTPHWRPYTQ